MNILLFMIGYIIPAVVCFMLTKSTTQKTFNSLTGEFSTKGIGDGSSKSKAKILEKDYASNPSENTNTNPSGNVASVVASRIPDMRGVDYGGVENTSNISGMGATNNTSSGGNAAPVSATGGGGASAVVGLVNVVPFMQNSGSTAIVGKTVIKGAMKQEGVNYVYNPKGVKKIDQSNSQSATTNIKGGSTKLEQGAGARNLIASNRGRVGISAKGDIHNYISGASGDTNINKVSTKSGNIYNNGTIHSVKKISMKFTGKSLDIQRRTIAENYIKQLSAGEGYANSLDYGAVNEQTTNLINTNHQIVNQLNENKQTLNQISNAIYQNPQVFNQVYANQQTANATYQNQQTNNQLYQNQQTANATYQNQQTNNQVYQNQQTANATYQNQQTNNQVYQNQQTANATYQNQQQTNQVNQQTANSTYQNQQISNPLYQNQQNINQIYNQGVGMPNYAIGDENKTPASVIKIYNNYIQKIMAYDLNGKSKNDLNKEQTTKLAEVYGYHITNSPSNNYSEIQKYDKVYREIIKSDSTLSKEQIYFVANRAFKLNEERKNGRQSLAAIMSNSENNISSQNMIALNDIISNNGIVAEKFNNFVDENYQKSIEQRAIKNIEARDEMTLEEKEKEKEAIEILAKKEILEDPEGAEYIIGKEGVLILKEKLKENKNGYNNEYKQRLRELENDADAEFRKKSKKAANMNSNDLREARLRAEMKEDIKTALKEVSDKIESMQKRQRNSWEATKERIAQSRGDAETQSENAGTTNEDMNQGMQGPIIRYNNNQLTEEKEGA